MSFPNPNTFGLIDNPLVFSVFVDGTGHGGGATTHDFLLLNGSIFGLLNGTNFLLLE